ELPAGVFSGLRSATIEAWVRLDHLDRQAPQLVYDYGRPRQQLSLGFVDGDTLWFAITDSSRPFTNVCWFPNAIRTNQWTHIAAVCGPGGMRLLLDGVSVERNPFPGGLASLGAGGRHCIGQTVTATDREVRFAGMIDEVRVWSEERSPRQVREDMFSKPVGNEPGLAACWSFDDGTARDAGPGRHDGRLMKSAQTRIERLPDAAGFQDRVLLSGRVSHAGGEVCLPSLVQLRADGQPLQSTLADPRGMFRMLTVRRPGVDYELIATHPHGAVTNADLHLRPGWDRLPPLIYPTAEHSLAMTNEFDQVLAEAVSRNPRLLLQLNPTVILRLIPRLGEAATALTELLDSPHADSRRAGAFLLGQVGVTSLPIVEALSKAVSDEDNDALTRGFALIGLRSLAVPEPLKGVYEKRNLAISYL
ncbi:MAG: LamG domain-containing protein, partial [Verrucomicrobiae bacterium]|nr:LamG domain-containing protein [Verrucomicrobiae bacterium]